MYTQYPWRQLYHPWGGARPLVCVTNRSMALRITLSKLSSIIVLNYAHGINLAVHYVSGELTTVNGRTSQKIVQSPRNTTCTVCRSTNQSLFIIFIQWLAESTGYSEPINPLHPIYHYYYNMPAINYVIVWYLVWCHPNAFIPAQIKINFTESGKFAANPITNFLRT